MNDATLIFPFQLFDPHPALSRDRAVVLVEDSLFFGDPHWPLQLHRQKLILHRASMMAYADRLRGQGYEVRYLAWQAGEAIAEMLDRPEVAGINRYHVCEVVDDVLARRLDRLPQTFTFLETPAFLSPDIWLKEVLPADKKPFMATFYQAQRKRLGILLDDEGGPLGGQWSYDVDNRKKLPRQIVMPEVPRTAANPHVVEATAYVSATFPDALGRAEPFDWPVTHEDAERWLDEFLAERFDLFGDYEDAISTRHRILFHSALTPALNLGLLTPAHITHRAVDYGLEHNVPLNSLEGFVRQIIGWREFMRAMYDRHGVDGRTKNFWQHHREMPASLYDATTGIEPLDMVIRRVLDHGYCHHIERLMVLGNFMLLCNIHPDAVYRWFMELFVDAYDWVMVPNVYGMSQFADGGLFVTKPYISGSNYIRKMSDLKKGPWCEVWDGLFWRFIAQHEDFFLGNYRLSMMARNLQKMDPAKRAGHLERADHFLAGL